MDFLNVIRDRSRTPAYGFASVCLLVTTPGAHAQLTHNITLGNPKALALGHAVTADPPGIDAIHFNPAGLAKIRGRQRSLKVLAASMTLEGEFGESHTQALETAFEDTYCQQSRDCFEQDPLANTRSSTSAPAVILPGGGVTDVPAMLVPFGGIALESPLHGWTFATAFYSPQAIGYAREEEDPAAFQGYKVSTVRLTYFSPSIGVQLNDTLALGASVGFSWQGVGVHTKFRAPEQTLQFVAGTFSQEAMQQILELSLIGPYANAGNVSIEMEDPLSLSFNVGLLWEPLPWLALGASYQHESVSRLKGHYRVKNSAALQTTTHEIQQTPALSALVRLLSGADINAQAIEEGRAESEYIVPRAFSIGSSLQVLPAWKLNTDLKWIDYSAWDSLDFQFDDEVDIFTLAASIEALGGKEDDVDPNALRMPRNYRDAVSYAVGIEHQYNDQWVLRMGYEPRKSVIPEDRLDFLVPIADAKLYTLGVGYQPDRTTQVDVALGYMVSRFNAPSGTSLNANNTRAGDVVYNPFAYLDFTGKTTAYLLAFSIDQTF